MSTTLPTHLSIQSVVVRPTLTTQAVWLRVEPDSAVVPGSSPVGAILTTEEAVKIANDLLRAAGEVTRATDPAYKIQAVFNEVFSTSAPRPDTAARALAEAGYRLVKDGE